MRDIISFGPSATPQTTNKPTAMSARILTIASTAIADTTPWWRSLESKFLVPKIIVNAAKPTAAHNAVRDDVVAGSCPANPSENTEKLSVSDCS